MKEIKIMGVNFFATTMNELLEILLSTKIKNNYICVSNVHTTVMSQKDVHYKKIQNSSYFTLTDGKPLQILAKKKVRMCERITGPDLMNEVFKATQYTNHSHFFYGSTEETLDKLIQNIRKNFPGIKILGSISPPYRDLTENETNDYIEKINHLNPTYLWVGLGAPKQEKWMYSNRKKINSLMIGVGAGFDYHAKNIKRAPKWMQKISCEWLYRLLQDPKRLTKRYIVYNSLFIYYLIKEKVRGFKN